MKDLTFWNSIKYIKQAKRHHHLSRSILFWALGIFFTENQPLFRVEPKMGPWAMVFYFFEGLKV